MTRESWMLTQIIGVQTVKELFMVIINMPCTELSNMTTGLFLKTGI